MLWFVKNEHPGSSGGSMRGDHCDGKQSGASWYWVTTPNTHRAWHLNNGIFRIISLISLFIPIIPNPLQNISTHIIYTQTICFFLTYTMRLTTTITWTPNVESDCRTRRDGIDVYKPRINENLWWEKAMIITNPDRPLKTNQRHRKNKNSQQSHSPKNQTHIVLS